MYIDKNNNIYIKSGDALKLKINIEGFMSATIGKTITFMVKTNRDDPDSLAVLTEIVTIVETDIAYIYIPSTTIKTISSGTYYWSVRYYDSIDYYTIVPCRADKDFPKLLIKEALIDE